MSQGQCLLTVVFVHVFRLQFSKRAWNPVKKKPKTYSHRTSRWRQRHLLFLSPLLLWVSSDSSGVFVLGTHITEGVRHEQWEASEEPGHCCRTEQTSQGEQCSGRGQCSWSCNVPLRLENWRELSLVTSQSAADQFADQHAFCLKEQLDS